MTTRLCPAAASTRPPARHPRTLLRKASALAAALLCAFGTAAQADSPTVAQLKPQVDALPNTTTQQKLMRAMLEWALGESTREANATFSSGLSWPTVYPYESNHAQIALDLCSDVNDILHPSGSNTPTQIGSAKGGSRTDLFPTIPHYNSGDRTNPIASAVDTQITSLVGSSNSYIGSANQQDFTVMQAFCSPASLHYADPALIPILFNFLNFTWDTVGYAVNGTTKSIDETSLTTSPDNTIDDTIPHDYLLLTTQFPDLILPRCRQRWEAGIYRESNLLYSKDNPPVSSGDPAQIYPNIQGRHEGNIFYTSQWLLGPYSTYSTAGFPYYSSTPTGAPSTNATPAQLKASSYAYIHIANNPAVQFPDGGFGYYEGSNTVGLYFGAEIQNIGYIRQIIRGYTGSDDVAAAADATSILERARLFLPLSYPHKGFFLDQGPLYLYWKAAFDQDPAWAAVFSLDPDLTSATDPVLWRFVLENVVVNGTAYGEVNLSLAASYDSDLQPATIPPDPDDYFVYDQNLEGPQGIFGDWQMLGSCRVSTVQTGGPESSVTCYGLWTTGSALWTATTTAADDPTTYGTVTAQDKVASTIVRPTFASLAFTHAISIRYVPHAHLNRPWSESQEWVYTPHRMVGLLNMKKIAADPAADSSYVAEVEAGIGFVSRSDNQTSAAYTQKASSTNVGRDFTFDTLVTHLVSSNYNGVVNSGANPTNFYVVDDGTANKGPTLVVSDSRATASHPNANNYAVGTMGYVLVDYHPTSENDATGIVTLPVATGLFAFEFRDTDGKMYRIVHNSTGAALSYTGTLDPTEWGSGAVIIHNAFSPGAFGSTTASPPIPDQPPVAGETYRPAWVGTNGTTSLSATVPTYAPISGGSITCSVPANSHVVLTVPENVVDGAVYELEPVCSPGTRLDVTSKGTASGTTVQLYQRDGGLNQQWEAYANGSNFQLMPMHTSDRSMDVAGGSTANGTQVDIATTVSSGSALNQQLWSPFLYTNGGVEFTPLNSPGSHIDVLNHGTANGTKIQIWTAGHYTNQEFHLIQMNPVLGIAPN